MVVKGFNPEMQTIIFFLQNNQNKLIKWRHWRLSSDHSVNATYICTALAEGWVDCLLHNTHTLLLCTITVTTNGLNRLIRMP